MTISFLESKDEETEQPRSGDPGAAQTADAPVGARSLKRRRLRDSQGRRDGLCIIVLGSGAQPVRRAVSTAVAKTWVEEVTLPAPPRRKQERKSSAGGTHWCVFDPGLGDTQPRSLTIDA